MAGRVGPAFHFNTRHQADTTLRLYHRVSRGRPPHKNNGPHKGQRTNRADKYTPSCPKAANTGARISGIAFTHYSAQQANISCSNLRRHRRQNLATSTFPLRARAQKHKLSKTKRRKQASILANPAFRRTISPSTYGNLRVVIFFHQLCNVLPRLSRSVFFFCVPLLTRVCIFRQSTRVPRFSNIYCCSSLCDYLAPLAFPPTAVSRPAPLPSTRCRD